MEGGKNQIGIYLSRKKGRERERELRKSQEGKGYLKGYIRV